MMFKKSFNTKIGRIKLYKQRYCADIENVS
jgi:hypothetical protein